MHLDWHFSGKTSAADEQPSRISLEKKSKEKREKKKREKEVNTRQDKNCRLDH